MIFKFCNYPLLNMVISRDSLFLKFRIMTKFPIKFLENLPSLVVPLLSEQEL